MRYLICYDIAEQKTRTKVAKYLESFAHRIQYSVFTCESTEERMNKVKTKLFQLTAKAESPLLYIAPMCKTCEEKVWSVGKPREQVDICIIA